MMGDGLAAGKVDSLGEGSVSALEFRCPAPSIYGGVTVSVQVSVVVPWYEPCATKMQ